MPNPINDAIEAVVGVMTIEELVDQTPVPEPVPEPVPVEATIRSIVEKLQHPAEHNGHLGIARSEGVSVGTVKKVEKAVRKRIRELTPDE